MEYGDHTDIQIDLNEQVAYYRSDGNIEGFSLDSCLLL